MSSRLLDSRSWKADLAIRIGPAGSAGLGYLTALKKAARLKLDCMEIAFTYGVRMRPEEAGAVGMSARKKDITLSVHAPYYINLAADDPAKRAASEDRILASCRMAAMMGARNVVFHAGFYQGRSAARTFARIAKAIEMLQAVVQKNRWDVTLCPETTGKPAQFGSLDECLQLTRETGCGVTVDFAHLLARTAGSLDYVDVLDRLPRRFHAHFSGIDYGPKGERKHVKATPQVFLPLAEALVGRNTELTLICESPDPYRDAGMMKRVVAKLLVRQSARTST
jgi:deoxyribonuclease-4